MHEHRMAHCVIGQDGNGPPGGQAKVQQGLRHGAHLAAQLGIGQAAPALCAVTPLGQRQGIRCHFGTTLRPFPTQRAQGCSAMVERSVKEPLSNWGRTARWAICHQLDEQGIPRTLTFKRLQRNAAPPRGAFIHHRGVRMWGVAASFSPTLRATLSPALPAVKP